MAASGQKLSRDDWRKKKELEEARKAGTAPAEVDEEGRDINPHIPQYISQAPWYVDLGRPSLSHQRPQEDKQKELEGVNKWYKRGIDSSKTATKFRKGACENCGSMTHKKKNCLERPRRVGARFTGDDIRPDEHVQPDFQFTYDAKRDRWNGYNTDQHQNVIEEFSKVEMAKRQLKAEKLQSDILSGKLTESVMKAVTNDSDDSDDEEKYADQADMAGTKFDPKTRTTVRNLRIREDTAKYLYNLDPNSAYYDPKTRSMRENPFKNSSKETLQAKFAGDNFVRQDGDVNDFAKSRMFAWEAFEHGTDIHSLADPTKLEVMHNEFKVKKGSFKDEQQKSILEQYGGEEHLDAPPKELLLAQTEEYVEYSRLGNVIKGQEKAVTKSRYEEDVFTNNHTTVWGSYWNNGKWGYGCCYSLVKGSYCTGDSGKLARKASQTVFSSQSVSSADDEGQPVLSMVEQHRAKRDKGQKKEDTKDEHEEERAKQERLNKALRLEEEHDRKMTKMLAIDERKRPYNSMRADQSREPTEEEMEAYRLKRRRQEDPMANFFK